MIKTKAILDFDYWGNFIPLFNKIEDLEEITLVDNGVYVVNERLFGC